MKNEKHTTGELASYVVGIRIQGHETWRFQIYPTVDGLEKDWAIGKHPKITAIKKFRFDRLTGKVSEL